MQKKITIKKTKLPKIFEQNKDESKIAWLEIEKAKQKEKITSFKKWIQKGNFYFFEIKLLKDAIFSRETNAIFEVKKNVTNGYITIRKRKLAEKETEQDEGVFITSPHIQEAFLKLLTFATIDMRYKYKFKKIS